MLSFIHPDHVGLRSSALELKARCKPVFPSSIIRLHMDARVNLHLASFSGDMVSAVPSRVSLQGLQTPSSSSAAGTQTIPQPIANRRSAAINRNDGAAGFGDVERVQFLQKMLAKRELTISEDTPPISLVLKDFLQPRPYNSLTLEEFSHNGLHVYFCGVCPRFHGFVRDDVYEPIFRE